MLASLALAVSLYRYVYTKFLPTTSSAEYWKLVGDLLTVAADGIPGVIFQNINEYELKIFVGELLTVDAEEMFDVIL